MKTITIPVDITVNVNDDVNPDDITFDIDLTAVKPQVAGITVGTAVEHTTGEQFWQ